MVSLVPSIRAVDLTRRFGPHHAVDRISFEPEVERTVTLDTGETILFEARDDFRVEGTGAIQVAQYLVGQEYDGIGTSDFGENGDPAYALAIPSEQLRSSYTFLSPATYERSFITVTFPDGARVRLDGDDIDRAPGLQGAFRSIPGTGFSTARIEVDSGQHEMESDGQGFGLVVYGFGAFTSYMVPGGLDFEEINPLI